MLDKNRLKNWGQFTNSARSGIISKTQDTLYTGKLKLQKFFSKTENKVAVGAGASVAVSAAIIIGALIHSLKPKDLMKMSEKDIEHLSESQALDLLPIAFEKFWTADGAAENVDLTQIEDAVRKTAGEDAYGKADECAKEVKHEAKKIAKKATKKAKKAKREFMKDAEKSCKEATEKEVAEKIVKKLKTEKSEKFAYSKSFADAWRKGGTAYNIFVNKNAAPTPLLMPDSYLSKTKTAKTVQERAINLLKVLKTIIKKLEPYVKNNDNSDDE